MGIPTIDISHFYEFEEFAEGNQYSDPSAERSKAINALLSSISTYGAFKITGHGIPGNTIQRVFESTKECRVLRFTQTYQKVGGKAAAQGWSTAWIPRTKFGGQGLICSSPDGQTATPWPVGVRGEILQMKMQPFSRDCANLHHDLLHILEEALELWDNELVSRWLLADGEVRCDHHPTPSQTTSSATHLEGLVSHIEDRGARTMLSLAFQDNNIEEIVVLCGATVRKWIRVRIGRKIDRSRTNLQPEEAGQPSKYFVSYIGYEDSTVFVT
ncbi:hypothetical protein PG991_013786 [Apiospora marii]|uniref:Non-haem dioxygenase N-terminal domain-containing protein n=1 Tax=Apiospora marii TaxID=335849 RepID=A0ABR1R742_9PEZI